MVREKIYWVVCIVCLFIECKQADVQPIIKLPGKDWINRQLAEYDSVYNIFLATDKISDASLNIRIKAQVYLDSVLRYEPMLAGAEDTTIAGLLLYTLYLKGVDMNDMRRYTDAAFFLNKYLALSKRC